MAMQTEIEFPEDVSTEARTNMKARSRRVRGLLGFISDNGLEMEETMLIARYAIANQVKGDTARAYLRELLDAQYVFRLDGHVLTMSDHEKMLKKDMKKTKK
jgi:hypothetical protein